MLRIRIGIGGPTLWGKEKNFIQIPDFVCNSPIEKSFQSETEVGVYGKSLQQNARDPFMGWFFGLLEKIFHEIHLPTNFFEEPIAVFQENEWVDVSSSKEFG